MTTVPVPQSKTHSRPHKRRAPFFYKGEAQRRAMDYLRYALEKERGVFALSGPAGVGKTSIARQAVREWKGAADAVVLLSGQSIGGNGIYRQLATGLKLAHYSLPQAKLLGALERNFAGRYSKGGRTLLVIDDADHLQHIDLDELNRLCALNRAGVSLLQVFLIGRRLPFAEPDRGDRQTRIDNLIGSYQVAPLAASEIAAFIQGWAGHEGYRELAQLPDGLIERVATWSEGRPRKLKRFCEQVRGIVAKGRGLAWDEALVERLLTAASEAFNAVQPSVPPVDFTVGSNTGSLELGRLQSGPVAPSQRKAVAQETGPSSHSPETRTEVLEMPASPVAPTPVEGALATPLAAVCTSVEEALLLAPLLKALVTRVGPCTVLVEAGELSAERPPWNSSSSQVAWRPLGLAVTPDANRAEALAAAVHRAATLLKGSAVRLLLSAGNSDSTLGMALAAHHTGVCQVRFEAGRRTGGSSKSQDTNQALLERLADRLLVSDSLAQVNLLMEGIQRNRIRDVGSLRVDALAGLLARAGHDLAAVADPKRHGARGATTGFALVVLGNERTCSPGHIELLLRVLRDVGEMLPIRLLVSQPLMELLHATDPVRQWRQWNIDMLALIDPLRSPELLVDARVVITDSGMMQVESTALRVPCITLAQETPWPITVECGANRLCGFNPVEIIDAVTSALTEPLRRDTVPVLWDGKAAQRAAHAVMELLAG